MSDARQAQLETILIGLLPANGSIVANGQLSAQWAGDSATGAGVIGV
jgi:hypothetical protein